jgi:hypothetical protein
MRLPAPGVRYDQRDEAAFRRLLEQALDAQATSVQLGGGLLYEDPTTGKLMFKGRSGTITQLALP